jgi:branched-chain amino acid transport system ATP-binding protein
MTELSLEDVSLRFGGLTVLDRISFDVVAGELLALIGPNGAGKTSILNCINGIYRPSGDIRFRRKSLIGLPPHEIAALGIARTFQHGELFPDMTAAENLLTARHCSVKVGMLAETLCLPSLRRERRRHSEAIDRVLDFVGISRFRDTVVSQLPFGLQKRVGVARALAAEPRLLLIDEPSAGLTHSERIDLAHLILKIRGELGIATIWIEHDMQMVADLADRVHVLDYGRSLADGTPNEVLRNAEVIRAYLGDVQPVGLAEDEHGRLDTWN